MLFVYKHTTDAERVLLVCSLKDGEYTYLLDANTREDKINRMLGNPIDYPTITIENIVSYLNSPNLDKYVISAMYRSIDGVDTFGDVTDLKQFYEIIRKNNLVLKGLEYTDDYMQIVNTFSCSSFRRLEIEYDKHENWFVRSSIIRDVSKFKTFAELNLDGRLDFLRGKDYKLVTDISEIKSIAKNELMYSKITATDWETTGLGVYNHSQSDEGVGLSFSWADNQAIYIPFMHEHCDNVPIKEVMDILREPLEKNPHGFTAHNAMFEKRCFYHYDIDCNITHDTLVIAHRLRHAESKEPIGLKPLTHRIYGVDTLDLKEVTGSGNETLFRYVPKDVITAYACPDSDYTRKLRIDLLPKIMNCAIPTYNNDMIWLNSFCKDEYDGIPCNTSLLQNGIEDEESDIEEIKKQAHSFVGKQYFLEQYLKKGHTEEEILAMEEYKNYYVNFDLNKPNQIKKIVFNVLQYPVIDILEKSGEPALTKGVFKKLLEEEHKEPGSRFKEDILGARGNILVKAGDLNRKRYPFILLLQKYRDYYKNVSSFLKPMYRDAVDNKIYTSYSLTRADTARNIDKVQTLKKSLRKSICRTDDWYMVVFDCAQEEIRIMYEMSNFTKMINVLNDPEKDSHRETAANFNNVKPYMVSGKDRADTKGVAFGKPYGMGVLSLMKNIRKPPYTAAVEKEVELINMKWEDFNEPVVNFLESCRNMALEKGYIKNRWGRIIYYDNEKAKIDSIAKGKIRRQAGNSPMQSYAADLLRIVHNRMTKLMAKRGLTGLIKRPLNIHDEMVLWVHKSVHVYKVYELIVDSAYYEGLNGMKYFWGISVVDNWLEGKEDTLEAPVNFVYEKLAEYKANRELYDNMEVTNQKTYIYDQIVTYMKRRYIDDIVNLCNLDINSEQTPLVDFDYIINNWEDYFLRKSITDYVPHTKYREYFDEKEDGLVMSLEQVFVEKLGKCKFKYKDNVYELNTNDMSKTINMNVLKTFDISVELDSLVDDFTRQEVVDMFEDEDDKFFDEIYVKNNYEDKFQIKKVKTENTGTIFDKVEFKGIVQQRFSIDAVSVYEKNSGFVITIDKFKKSQLESLMTYLRSLEKGDRTVTLTKGGKEFPTGLLVKTLDYDMIGEIVGRDVAGKRVML